MTACVRVGFVVYVVHCATNVNTIHPTVTGIVAFTNYKVSNQQILQRKSHATNVYSKIKSKFKMSPREEMSTEISDPRECQCIDGALLIHTLLIVDGESSFVSYTSSKCWPVKHVGPRRTLFKFLH